MSVDAMQLNQIEIYFQSPIEVFAVFGVFVVVVAVFAGKSVDL